MAAKTAKDQGKKGQKSESVVEISVPENASSFATPLVILVSAVIIAGAVVYAGSRMSDGDSTLGVAKDSGDNSGEVAQEVVGDVEGPGDVLGTLETFTEYDTEICKEDGKPVVYLFSTTWCPHCEWIIDTFDTWAKDNSDKIAAYHWELDTYDNTLTSEVETEVPADHEEVYNAFNPSGSIPTFVFGCRYGRVGNGYEAEDDLDQERSTFDTILQEII